MCGVVRAPRPTSCAVTLRRGRRPRRPVSRGLILPCRGGRLCPPCMTVAPCRAGPMCPAAGYAFFGGARGPRPTGQVRYPPVGDGVSTSRQRGAAALSLRGAPQGYLLRGAKRRGNPFPFHKSPPKSQQFPTKFCAPIQNMEISPETVAQGTEECYILTVNRIRAAPMGAGFFSYLFRKRITGRLRNKF